MTTQELRRLAELRIKQKAGELFPTFSDSERFGFAFGLFPESILQAQAQLLAEINASPPWSAAESEYMLKPDEVGRLLSVALMDLASRK